MARSGSSAGKLRYDIVNESVPVFDWLKTRRHNSIDCTVTD